MSIKIFLLLQLSRNISIIPFSNVISRTICILYSLCCNHGIGY